jgi:sensor histidine kinase YesM
MTRRERLKAVFGFDDTWFIIIGIPLVSFFIPLLFFNGTLSNGLAAYLPKWGVSLAYTCAYWFSARPIFAYFRKRFNNYKETRKRVLYTGIAIVVMFMIWNLVLDFLHFTSGHFGHEKGVTEFDYMVASFTILAFVGTLYESIFFYARWKLSIIETEKLKRENVQSQLEGLKSQVNPHFLFNSLNTLTYIIPEDPEKAVKFVQKLSKVYRYILEIRDKKIISLTDELDFLNSYIFLLEERFGENITININVPKSARSLQIVPLSLQILFENAIKHNIISHEKPLFISVSVENHKHILIKNNLQKKRQTMPSTKVGLQNIKNRYAYFSDEKVDIQETAGHFIVSLPLLNIPQKVLSEIEG